MDVCHAEFITSAVNQNQYLLDGLPEFALVGRSNVGKSSFVNCIAGRRNLARTSNSRGGPGPSIITGLTMPGIWLISPAMGMPTFQKPSGKPWVG